MYRFYKKLSDNIIATCFSGFIHISVPENADKIDLYTIFSTLSTKNQSVFTSTGAFFVDNFDSSILMNLGCFPNYT